MRHRQERVRQVIEANPDQPKAVLAKLAGVSARTIQAVRNSTAAEGEKAFSPGEPVKLTDLYDHDDASILRLSLNTQTSARSSTRWNDALVLSWPM